MRYTTNERKRKRKSLILTLLLMGGVIGGFLFPFLSTALETETPAYESVVVVDFTQFDNASAAPSRAKAAAPKRVAKKRVPEPRPVPEPVAAKKPVVTAPTPTPPVPTNPEPPPVPEPEPQPDPTPEPAVEPTPEPVEAPVADAPEESAEASTAASGRGSATTGAGNADGDAADDGDGQSDTPGTGTQGRDFSGDGIFGRRVVYRANVKGLTKETGKMVVNLCVNRTGRVTYVALDEAATTIEDPELRANAERVTRKYRFEKDYTAPREQCGKLTFVFKVPTE